MENGLTSEELIRLKRSEYLDCPNCCNARSAKWYKGDAICPKCGEMAVVYDKPTQEHIVDALADANDYELDTVL